MKNKASAQKWDCIFALSLTKVLLGDLSVIEDMHEGPWTEDEIAAARQQISRDIHVCRPLALPE